ncbi:MAG: deoxyribonuclease IV [Vulcanimicrobiota bacterium]
MKIGGHFPISRGLLNSLVLLKEAGGNTLQIFSKNPGQWKSRIIDKTEASQFVQRAGELEVSPIIIHDSYLINLATPDPILRKKSIKSFIHEIERAQLLGATYLVTHMGSHTGAGEEEGLKNIASALIESLEATSESNIILLLETTAGQGTQLGYNFSQLGRVIDLCSWHSRLGVCLDTCHVFAAGYNLSTAEGYRRTFDEFKKEIGLSRLNAIHLNDAQKPFNSRVDRHAHIGQGNIGLEGFSRIMNDPVLQDIPLILETPQPEKMHKKNIELLKSLIKGDKNDQTKTE